MASGKSPKENETTEQHRVDNFEKFSGFWAMQMISCVADDAETTEINGCHTSLLYKCA